MSERAGPLVGVRVIEIAAIGPVPHAGMLFADLGADVIRVDRPADREVAVRLKAATDILGRGHRSVVLDLQTAEGVGRLLELVESADVLLEGMRPGVAERLGFGPEVCLARNLRLVYGRMTGWGQAGPRASTSGHDLNYIALSGVLHAMGYADRPPSPPLNLVGDYGGGSMLLGFGVVAALWERERSGRGQVVDAAMVDGAVLLSSYYRSLLAAGLASETREANLLDGGAHFYRVYRTADGRFISVAALEPRFYAELLGRLGLNAAEWPQDDRTRWSVLRERMAEVFAARPLADWMELFGGSDACVAPVLTFLEAAADEHNRARGAFVEQFGVVQPAPAPRFSRTPGHIASPPPEPGQHNNELLD